MAIRSFFREFKASDNVVRHGDRYSEFNGVSARVCPPGTTAKPRKMKEAIVGGLPQQDNTIQLSKRAEEIREWEKIRGWQNTKEVLNTLLPQDLMVTSTGFLGQRQRLGIRYGADLSQLPVPPLVTLQPYSPDGFAVVKAVNLKVQKQSSPFPLRPQDLSKLLYWFPGEQQLLAETAKPGEAVELEVPIPQWGIWSLKAHLARGPEFGVVKLYVNGVQVTPELDLYADEVSPMPVLYLGEYNGLRGNVVLRIEVVGSSPLAPKPGFRFGIERVVLRSVE